MQNWTEKQFLPNALEPFTLSYCVRSPSYSTQKHRGTYIRVFKSKDFVREKAEPKQRVVYDFSAVGSSCG